MIGHFALKGSNVIPLQFIGLQGRLNMAVARMFVIKKEVPGEGFNHPVNSSLMESTLVAYGYRIV